MAIDDPLDEHEQSERVLEWLRQNALGLIGGVALGLAAIAGWKWWQQQQEQQQLAQADRYQAAMDAIEANDGKAADQIKALGEGIYATLGGLQLAHSQVISGNADAAAVTLRSVKTSDPAIQSIVDQRLARLLIDAGKAKEALALVEGSDTAAALELRGDAQFALGQADKARDAYTKALAKADVASPQHRLLELKLTQVGAPAAIEAKS